jgi:hypothetical protein
VLTAQSIFGLGKAVDVDITLTGQDARKAVEVCVDEGRKERQYLFYDGETVSGKVSHNYICLIN